MRERLGVRYDPLTRRYTSPGEVTVRRVLVGVDGDALDGAVGRWVGQAADVSVAQPVEDQGEQFAGGGDLGDIARASGPRQR